MRATRSSRSARSAPLVRDAPRSAPRALALAALLLASAATTSGCVGYVWALAQGQAVVVGHAVTFPEAVRRRYVGPAGARKFAVIEAARLFGFQQVGLTPSDNYTLYFDTFGASPSTTVTAAHPLALRPLVWSFPLVGAVPYRGYFQPNDARRFATELAEQGYDVRLQAAAAFSTLGWFTDPVFTNMLGYDDDALIALILHELTHGTVYVNGDADFNETLATFVERQATLEFLALAKRVRGLRSDPRLPLRPASRGGAKDPLQGIDETLVLALDRLGTLPDAEAVRAKHADQDHFRELIEDLRSELKTVYAEYHAGRLTEAKARERKALAFRTSVTRYRSERRAGRFTTARYDWYLAEERTFFRHDNAMVLGLTRYGGALPAFERAYKSVGRDWQAFLALMRRAAKATAPAAPPTGDTQESPRTIAWLKAWLAARGDTGSGPGQDKPQTAPGDPE